jgi:sulfatase maturation enzyme AslB (radical SAM superfamily)
VVSSLYLMPTTECNCECSYCYVGERARRPHPGLMEKVSRSWMDWLRSGGGGEPREPQIRFTGGEPWMEPELVGGISGRFLDGFPGGRVVVNTNGTLVRHDIVSRFTGDTRFMSVVSLDGPRWVHDARRRLAGGGSAFDRAMEGIRLLREMSLPVCVNAVLDPDTAEALEDLLDVVAGLGMDRLSLSLLYEPGRRLTPEERFGLLRRAYRLAAERCMRVGGHHRLLLGHRIPGLECMAGRKTALVDPGGMVYACQRFVGRAEPDCAWTDRFDWAGFGSGHCRVGVCMTGDDLEVGDLLMDMYREEFPGYLSVNDLDRFLFGVLP